MYTDGEANKVVLATRLTPAGEKNGWEAWRRLNLQFEKTVSATKAHARQALAAFYNRKARNKKESKTMMAELERTVRWAEDVA